ncbi:MAG: hypothetical protein RH942_14120 [Kiloniellaceae bacterium]
MALLALGAVERPASAATSSAQVAVAVDIALAAVNYGPQRIVHPGHVRTHRTLPPGDTNLALCKILCALAVSQSVLAAPDSFGNWPATHERVTANAQLEADQVSLGLQPAPPR